MPSPGGMVFRYPLGMSHARRHCPLEMNCMRFFSLHRIANLLTLALFSIPSLVCAHPGHYHPDETDEFDFLRASLFHSHGILDYVLAGVAIASVAVICVNGKAKIRVTALFVALGSIALIPLS